MSREIKFRAWDIDEKKFHYDICLKPLGEVIAMEIYDGEMLLIRTRCLVDQYTGLKDKNGKEIYEGDIIESWYLNGDGNGGYYDAGNFEVIFKNGAFGVARKNNFYTFDEIEWDELEDLKVIGNIHESPELLNGAK